MRKWGDHYVWICTAILWLKLYAVQRVVFDFKMQGWMDELMIAAGALSSAVLLNAIALFFFKKRPEWGLVTSSAIMSILVVSHVVYFRFFHDFITVSLLVQSGNYSALKYSLFHLIQPWDILLLADTIVLVLLARYKKLSLPSYGIRKKAGALCIVFALCLTFNWTQTISSAEETEASVIDDRFEVVKQAGLVNYQLYDVATLVQRNSKKWFSEEEDFDAVARQMEQWQDDAGYAPLEGVAEGYNVVFISMESLQSFVLEREVAGQEVTPFLNELIKESFYFSEYYDQTAQGKTSDAEFMVETSLFPLSTGSVFFLHAENEYDTLAKTLKEAGYETAVFHANDRTFWNRDQMYESIGYDRFYDVSAFDVNEENTIGWGLNDRDFFEQSLPYLADIPEPFMAKWITLTNHHPFEIDLYPEWRANIQTDDETVAQYFATVRFMDEALRHFFERIRNEEWYERTVFVLYGDHYGLSPHYHEEIKKALGEDEKDAPSELELKKVPLIIHIPGMKGQRLDTIGGHVDIKPTILHLLGLKEDSPVRFGHSLFSVDHPELVVFRDGSFVSKQRIFYGQTCYDRADGTELEPEQCRETAEIAAQQLKLSDEIIYGDLLRFADEDDPDSGRTVPAAPSPMQREQPAQ